MINKHVLENDFIQCSFLLWDLIASAFPPHFYTSLKNKGFYTTNLLALAAINHLMPKILQSENNCVYIYIFFFNCPNISKERDMRILFGARNGRHSLMVEGLFQGDCQWQHMRQIAKS